VTESEQRSLHFYDQLGAARLAARTAPEWDRQTYVHLTGMLRPGQRILDVGCGYGRIAVPLAAAGHDVVGVDISRELLRAAQQSATQQHASVVWIQATMRHLPLAPATFDVALCLWSAFYELLTEREQSLALAAIAAVLRPGGWALIEGPIHALPAVAGPERPAHSGNRVAAVSVHGLTNYHYQHDTQTLSRLASKVGVTQSKVYTADWAGRERQFLWVRR